MRSRLSIPARAALLLLLTTFVSSSAQATNGARPISSGARAAGRGGADTAVADDATAMNTNPAGLGFIDGQRFDQTIALFVPTIKWTNPTGSYTSGRPSTGGVIGGSFGLCFDLDEAWHLREALTFQDEIPSDAPLRTSPDYDGSTLKFGLGVFPLNGNFIDFDARSPFFNDRDYAWETEIKEVGVALAVAWRPVHWLSVGISPMFVYSQLENDQPVAQPSSILKGHPFGTTGPTYAEASPFLGVNYISGYADIDNATTFGGRLRTGMLAIPVEWDDGMLRIGLSYATQTVKQDYLGEATVDFSKQIQTVDPDGTLLKPIIAANTGIPEDQQTFVGKSNLRLKPLELPHEVSLGAAVQVSRVLISTEVTWFGWSQSFKSFKGKLTNGESAELNELTGDQTGEVELDIPLDWNDQLVFATGIAFAPVDWAVLRVGYNYGRNPVPNETVQPTTPAILEHHLTLGVGFHIQRLEVSLAYEHDFENSVHVVTSRSNPEVNDSTISAQLDTFALGLSLRF
jgi:long-subunit fatty acid transport protein